MRTHQESIFTRETDLRELDDGGTSDLWSSREELQEYSMVAEFVPAAAYLALKAQLVEAWSAGYVAGQECAKDGVPRRNPFAMVEKGEEP